MPIKDPRNRMPKRDSTWAYLDEELCFQKWNETGDVGRATRAMQEEGFLNPDTGRPPSRPGVYIAALRYISKNIEVARQAIIGAGGDWANDRLLYLIWVLERMQQSNTLGRRSRNEWNAEIVAFAQTYLTSGQYEEFLPKYYAIVGAEPVQQ